MSKSIKLKNDTYISDKSVVHNHEVLETTINNIENRLQNQEIYSTNETIVGTWIDGRPIYRKVINFGSLPNNAEKKVETNLPFNTTFFIKIEGYAKSSGANIKLPDISLSSVSSGTAMWISSDGKVDIQTKSNKSSYTSCYVILEYIKN